MVLRAPSVGKRNGMTRRTPPNIVYFLVDDMGYGDVSCLNPQGKIPTPNIDGLARDGLTLTDAHATSAVCSPSRYGILTGRYNWRSSLQQGIVGLYGEPLIAPNRLTVPAFLQQHGYHTACIGKWHLGQGWPFPVHEAAFHPGKTAQDLEASKAQRACWREAFAQPTTGGPTTRGFDYYFGVDVPNWPPYCFIENDRTVGIPSEFLPTRLVGDNLASYSGPAMPYWHFEQLLPAWAKQADRYIQERASTGAPFFLYLPMTSPHTPLSVNKPWIGKSGLNNLYADLVMETDAIFGRVLASLEQYGVAGNTLVIFASDNGCAHYIGAAQLEAQGTTPAPASAATNQMPGMAVIAFPAWRAGPVSSRRAAPAMHSCAFPTCWRPVPRSSRRRSRQMPAKTASACCRFSAIRERWCAPRSCITPSTANSPSATGHGSWCCAPAPGAGV